GWKVIGRDFSGVTNTPSPFGRGDSSLDPPQSLRILQKRMRLPREPARQLVHSRVADFEPWQLERHRLESIQVLQLNQHPAVVVQGRQPRIAQEVGDEAVAHAL